MSGNPAAVGKTAGLGRSAEKRCAPGNPVSSRGVPAGGGGSWCSALTGAATRRPDHGRLTPPGCGDEGNEQVSSPARGGPASGRVDGQVEGLSGADRGSPQEGITDFFSSATVASPAGGAGAAEPRSGCPRPEIGPDMSSASGSCHCLEDAQPPLPLGQGSRAGPGSRDPASYVCRGARALAGPARATPQGAEPRRRARDARFVRESCDPAVGARPVNEDWGQAHSRPVPTVRRGGSRGRSSRWLSSPDALSPALD